MRGKGHGSFLTLARPELALGALLLLCGMSCANTESAPPPKAQTRFREAGAVAPRAGEDWPGFLGPRQNGISGEIGLLATWPEEGPPVLWSKDLGTGYSAPSVRGERVVVFHRRGDEELAECLRCSDGEPLWSFATKSRYRDPYGYNNGPRCSPVLTEQRCYTLGAEGKLTCLELQTGKKVWQRDLLRDFQIPDAFFGVGASPLLEGGKLIVLVGGQPNSGVVAFDPESGKTLWENVGKSTWDGAQTIGYTEPVYRWTGEEMSVSYSSAVAATFHGQRHVLCLMRQGLVSVNPETGQEYFHYWFRSRTHESVNAAAPVVVDDTILLGAAYRVGSVRLQVAPDGRSVRELWRHADQLATHWSTSIYHDGCYYGFSGRHENEALLQCVDAETGKIRWQTPGWERTQDLEQDVSGAIIDRKTGKPVSWPLYGRGSAILAENKLIVLGERGTLALVEADKASWKELARCAGPRMKYPSWTAPVLSRGRLYLRAEDALVCLEVKAMGGKDASDESAHQRSNN